MVLIRTLSLSYSLFFLRSVFCEFLTSGTNESSIAGAKRPPVAPGAAPSVGPVEDDKCVSEFWLALQRCHQAHARIGVGRDKGTWLFMYVNVNEVSVLIKVLTQSSRCSVCINLRIPQRQKT